MDFYAYFEDQFFMPFWNKHKKAFIFFYIKLQFFF